MSNSWLELSTNDAKVRGLIPHSLLVLLYSIASCSTCYHSQPGWMYTSLIIKVSRLEAATNVKQLSTTGRTSQGKICPGSFAQEDFLLL
jgi:hypothetical protein